MIDNWLAGDRKAPRKQRHTAKRVFQRLRKEVVGFDCSYRLVAQYVAYRKSQMNLDNKKGYLPLIHHPGEGQADFGAAQFYENSRYHDGKYLVLSFPYSNGGYPQLMYGENAECFMESMIAIFDHIGGVPCQFHTLHQKSTCIFIIYLLTFLRKDIYRNAVKAFFNALLNSV